MIALFSCSEEATRQLVSEGAVESIVALTSHGDSCDVVNAATSLLLSIASSAPSLRQHLGRAGAVKYFVHCLEEQVTSDGTLPHKYHVIDALCQCCRDANNRIRVREQGALSVLIDLLSNDKFTSIHDRIISALVCFIYDDASIAVLLHNQLVPTLISHLYRVAGVEKKPDLIGLDSFDLCESLKMDLTETTDADLEYLDDAYMCHNDLKSAAVDAADQSTSFLLDTEVKQNSDLLRSASFVDFNMRKNSTNTADLEPLSAIGTSGQVNADSSEGKIEFVVDEPVVPEPDTIEMFSQAPRYSINSPTYKAVSAWRMELAADEDEDSSTHDRHSPRNIWEGARLYAENSSPSTLRPGSVSPARSLGSCSDGLCSVRSWSSSLCDSSPQRSPAVSPAWSLDSSNSGMYSPFSNSSYVYPDGACSPPSFSDADEAQPMSLSQCECSDSQLEAVTASHDNESFQARSVSVTDTLSKSTVDVHLAENTADTDLSTVITDVLDTGQQKENKGISCELTSTVDISSIDKNDSIASAVRSKLEGDNEEECEKQCSDDEFDVESFQRKRQDERKLSRLLDIAQSMYASIETEAVLQSHQTKKRRRSCSGNTSPSRQKYPCTDVCNKIENRSRTIETADTSDLKAKDLQNSSIRVRDDTDCPAEAAQCVQTASNGNSGEVSSDAESVASDDISACSIHHQNTSRVTERNILTLLSRFSHSPETVNHVMNAATVCGLLDYALLASNPLPAAGRTLLRLSRSHHGFQQAVLCLLPVHAAWRMEADWLSSSSSLSDSSCRCHSDDFKCLFQVTSVVGRNDSYADIDSVDHRAFSEYSQSRKPEIRSKSEMTEMMPARKKGNHRSSLLPTQVDNSNSSTKSAEAECKEECATLKLCDEVIANLSTIAISGYGQGVVSHLMLRGSRHQRERCVISLCFLCRFVFYVIILLSY